MEEIRYTIEEMKAFLSRMSEQYDVARLVNASECYTIGLGAQGSISYEKNCYCVWERDGRCKNCSSYRAHITGVQQEKTESFHGKFYHILSIPATLLLRDGSPCACVIELITISGGEKDTVSPKRKVLEKLVPMNIQVAPVLEKDLLTGMYSKEEFFRKVRQLLQDEPERKRYIIYGDIDDFKILNDLFGRIKGNEVLLKVADGLQSLCGMNDVCSRVGADTFLVCLEEARFSQEELELLAERIEGAINRSASPVHLRFGVYKIDNLEITVSVMADCAKMALKTIKGDTIKRVAYYDHSLVEQKRYEQQVVSDFETALRERQFQIYLQPQISSQEGLQGAEVLVRWVHPEKGLIPPMDFIGILEKTGLISRLDANVWEQSAELLQRWEGTEKEKLYLSINLSAKDFYYLDVYETVTALVEKYGIDPGKLRLEITESVLMSDVDKLLAITRKLHQYGFFIEIDDFGKGYSSLSMLKDIDADVLKIDMEFLHETEHEEKSRIILGSIIDMSKKLGMSVITEGVETKVQMEHLQALGCDMFQGYYFAKPMPVSDFESKYF